MQPKVLVFALMIFGAISLSGCVTPSPSAQSVPTNRQELVSGVQSMLTEKGFEPGPVDGVAGARTLSALAAFQRSRDLPATRGVTEEAYRQLLADRSTRSQGNVRSASRQTNESRSAREAAARRELARNDPKVTFRANCPGLYIPVVEKIMFQGAVPAYAMNVLNDSQNRYSVRYDMTYNERTENYFGRFGGATTAENRFISRPGSYARFMLAAAGRGSTQVTSVEKIVVLSCERT